MLQNQTPIYNVATGTCLQASEAKINAPIVLDLCSNTQLNAWDLS